MSEYTAFLAAKAPLDPPSGMREVPPLPVCLKPFQRAITAWALRRGRAAIFAGTGLGKTLMQLSWARCVADQGSAVLILTPLAVAEQTVAEAAKFGVVGVSYAPDRHSTTSEITVTNYERFEKFNIADFAGIVLDECFAAGTPVDVVTECGMPDPLPEDWEARDSIGSHNVAIEEIGKRVKAGEPLPQCFRSRREAGR